MSGLLIRFNVHFNPPLKLGFECLQGLTSPDICCQSIGVIGTSMSETISWKNTLASESLVQPDTLSAVLPGVVCVA